MTVPYLGRDIRLSQGASRSALVLIDFFNTPPLAGDLKDSKVLELGSGTGLAGMAASLHGASVDFTDQSIVMELLEENARRNLDAARLSRARFQELQWHDDNTGHPLAGTRYDYIIAADVIYARESMQVFVDTLNRFADDETVIYLAYVQRFPWAKTFFELMESSYHRTLVRHANGVWVFRFERQGS